MTKSFYIFGIKIWLGLLCARNTDFIEWEIITWTDYTHEKEKGEFI